MKTTKILSLILPTFLLQFTLPVLCSSDALLDSWKNINKNYANDIEQSNQIYNKLLEEQRALAELRSIVERHLRTKNAERLVNVIRSINISSTANNLKEILQELNDNYNNQMVEEIFAAAIDEIILTNKLSTLPKMLWGIYEKNDTKSFDLMLRAQLQLYNIFDLKLHTREKEFLHNFSNRLYIIKKESLYNTVDLNLKLKVQNIVEQLPFNLKYLYFMPYFCLSNIKYSTYIYTAIELKVDPSSRYIWLWSNNNFTDETCYIKADVGELKNDNVNKLNVALKGLEYNIYYYMMPNSMKIAGWESKDAPFYNIWNIEFLDNDRVVFSQNDYLMCAVENHDNDRRNVGGLKIGTVSSMNSECQWRLGKCISKIKTKT